MWQSVIVGAMILMSVAVVVRRAAQAWRSAQSLGALGPYGGGSCGGCAGCKSTVESPSGFVPADDLLRSATSLAANRSARVDGAVRGR
ncbi:MAG: hypothetical protein RIS70_609 [Planctomycetota bacterium]|jgi:hypothetical protein